MWTWGGRKAVFGGRTGDSTGVKGGKPSSAPSTTDKRGVKSRTRGDKYKPDVVVWVKKKSTRVKRTQRLRDSGFGFVGIRKVRGLCFGRVGPSRQPRDETRSSGLGNLLLTGFVSEIFTGRIEHV